MTPTRLLPASALALLLAGCPADSALQALDGDRSDSESPTIEEGARADAADGRAEIEVEVFDARSGDMLPDALVCADQPGPPTCGFSDLDGVVALRVELDPLKGRAATDGLVLRVRRDGYMPAVTVPYGLESGALVEVELRTWFEMRLQAAEARVRPDAAAGHILVEVYDGESRFDQPLAAAEVLAPRGGDVVYVDSRRGMVSPHLDATTAAGSALVFNVAAGKARVEVLEVAGRLCGAESGWAAAPGQFDLPVAAGSLTTLRVACHVQVRPTDWDESPGTTGPELH